jgi:hypothetical protein
MRYPRVTVVTDGASTVGRVVSSVGVLRRLVQSTTRSCWFRTGKWNTDVQSFAFYHKNAAVIERVKLEQKWPAPELHDHYDLVIDAPVPMHGLIEHAERGDTKLSEFSSTVGQQGGVEAAARSGEREPIPAPGVVRPEVRDSGASRLYALAYVFTFDVHARFQIIEQQSLLRADSEVCPTWRPTCSTGVCLRS